MTKPIVAHKDPKLPPPPAVSDGPDWTAALSALEPHTAETLLVVMRTLCPHDRLPDRVYRRTVVAFDRLHNAMPECKALVLELVTGLDALMPFPFREAAEIYRIEMLHKLEHTAAFRFVQRTTVRFLYDDLEVWEAFGYEGASVHLGGYIERGFSDLDWLPEPPAGA